MLPPILIKRIPPPSLLDFNGRYLHLGYPVVIKGLVDHWPARKLWNAQYFAEEFGNVKVSAVGLKEGKVEISMERGIQLQNAPLNTFLAEGQVITTRVEDFPASLKNDYEPPIYCAGGKFLNSRVIISSKEMVTPLHQDMPENLYVMLEGKKRITLFPPSDKVYPYSRFSRLPNYSQVDVEQPDYNTFPQFQLAQPYVVDLEAGETLFIPSFWWHHLRHLEASTSINFWWSQGWKVPIALAALLYSKFRKIGNQSA
jgi:hypothetical protein